MTSKATLLTAVEYFSVGSYTVRLVQTNKAGPSVFRHVPALFHRDFHELQTVIVCIQSESRRQAKWHVYLPKTALNPIPL